MHLSVINSGSSGNAYILEEGGNRLLLECGEPLRAVKQRLGYDLTGITACIVTHEHQDHAKHVASYIDSYIPVYMSHGTKRAVTERYHLTDMQSDLITALDYSLTQIGAWRVIPFPTQHDAEEPVGYVIIAPSGDNLLFATDTYYIKPRFRGLKHLLIECNYIDELADANYEDGHIDYRYYQRLQHSHMSLHNCLNFLGANDLSKTRTITLCHLSEANSDQRAMIGAITGATGIPTYIAQRGAEIALTDTPF